MKLHVWGTDFRRSDSHLRSALYVAPEKRAVVIQELLELGFRDMLYIATCNRIEFYTSAKSFYADTRGLWIKLIRYFGLEEDAFYRGYHLEGKSALRHLLRVSGSLESLVVGEPQILGQLKDSLRWNKEQGFPMDPSMEKALILAFETAKKIRSETSIGAKPVSVAALGIQRLESLENQHPLRKVVLVGRSPMTLVVAQWLKKSHPEVEILWVNRSLANLDATPEASGCLRMSLAEFQSSPPDFSHLITATASTEPIFGPEFFEKLNWDARLILDLAEPADVAVPCGCEEKATIIHLENLSLEAEKNRKSRVEAVKQAEVLIEQAIKEYFLRLKQGPVLKDFSAVEPKVLKELERAIESLGEDFSVEVVAKVKKWGEKLVRKNLHDSREHLRSILSSDKKPKQVVR